MSSDLHIRVLKLKTTQPIIVYNSINMFIMLEFLTEDGLFQILFILFLDLMFVLKYRFNQIWTLTPLMDKLDTCIRLSIKLRLSGNIWKP